ncbi:hypothetical protein FB45DRAFT_367112 [Roridomyces roridus]|uniref:Uncharacterized protein n=1 Tax=Roridomyces roridus TaxID=1738132 RepID=A0AAD7FBM6_9AGAR|nr:hypothetical protein FB45DRAFT_367112 [Roridomyces roridus]
MIDRDGCQAPQCDGGLGTECRLRGNLRSTLLSTSMSDHSKQPNFLDKVKGRVKDGAHKALVKVTDILHSTPPRSPAPSPRPAQSPTSALGPPPGATPISTPTPQSTPSGGDNGEDASKGADTAHTDTSNVAQAKTEFDWQAWNIDGNAISELQKWGTGHENSKWRKLADAIDHCLKSKTLEAVQDFIPDGPVPVKTLVKALLSIVQLGINVPVIQKKVYDFAQEAIEYIRTLVGIVGEEASVQRDLGVICTAVNKICKWANEHVRKMTVSADALGDWSSEFTKAKEMFLVRPDISLRTWTCLKCVPFRPRLFFKSK